MRIVLQPKTLILLAGFLYLTVSNLHAQSSWTSLQTINQVNIEYSEPVNCNFSQGTVQAEYIFLRINNLNAISKTVSFRIDSYYKGSGCGTCNNDEYLFSFQVPANGTISADCNFTETGLSKLAIFKKFISKKNNREFEKFEISNITVQ